MENIEYLSHNIMVSDSWEEEVSNRQIPKELPKHAYAFRFFSRTVVQTNDGETLKGDKKDYSGWHYFGHKEIYTLDEVKEKHPEHRILISNMESNNWKRVIEYPNGKWYNMNDNDTIFNQ
jgi:hypothetical protein